MPSLARSELCALPDEAARPALGVETDVGVASSAAQEELREAAAFAASDGQSGGGKDSVATPRRDF